MPELPEVETTRRGIEPYLIGRKFIDCNTRNTNLRIIFNKNLLNNIYGSEIIKVMRVAKYLKVILNNNYSLVFHLGMTGFLRIAKHFTIQKHDHLIFKTDDNTNLIFNDSRRFGLCKIIKPNKKFKLLENNGPDPFQEIATGDYLYKIIKDRTANIKAVLLNNKIISGIGNIYACEILWDTRINPRRKAKRLSKKQCTKIINSAKEILTRAINSGGTTLKDYFNADLQSGYFKIELKAYDREGEGCKRCSGKIKRIVQANRSTFFCSKCQTK